MSYPKIAQFKDAAALRGHLDRAGIELPLDDRVLTAAAGSPLAEPIAIGGFTVGNRFCIHPMEGWDANPDGSPSALTLRRWRRFGLSGAKLVWGGEAAAVQADGRANPRQTLATPENEPGLRSLLAELLAAHEEHVGTTADLLVGLQLTHSGRFSRPHGPKLEPRIACRHPLLDAKFGIDPGDDSAVWTDEELDRLVERFVAAAGVAHRAGFRFVDVKACHGYLLHEFLGARGRPGPFGGDYAGRTRLLRSIIAGIRAAHPELAVVVRLSAFDSVPYVSGRDVGRPMDYDAWLPYDYGFGIDRDRPLEMDLTETRRLVADLEDWGVAAINVTGGSPYYNPHMQRPAIFPPSDGYLPPEDPLVGVARQLRVTRECRAAVRRVPVVGSGYSYLQDFLPHVAQAAVREGAVDLVGLGRMVLSYPELPQDCLLRGRLERKKVCRTFSDCTTAPRHGIVSGCYPLDAHYKEAPDAALVLEAKRALKTTG
jgi:NADPH2 dehydrogenase